MREGMLEEWRIKLLWGRIADVNNTFLKKDAFEVIWL